MRLNEAFRRSVGVRSPRRTLTLTLTLTLALTLTLTLALALIHPLLLLGVAPMMLLLLRVVGRVEQRVPGVAEVGCGEPLAGRVQADQPCYGWLLQLG